MNDAYGVLIVSGSCANATEAARRRAETEKKERMAVQRRLGGGARKGRTGIERSVLNSLRAEICLSHKQLMP